MSNRRIDVDRLRARVRGLPHSMIFSMLDEAFDLLSPTKLNQLVGRYLPLEDVRSEAPAPKRDSPGRLHAATLEFAAASRRGDYYETFRVDSRNCTEQSNGTIAWIAECNRLLDRCVALSSRRRGARDVADSFELLFDLISDVDTCEVEIIFFADEGGADEIGVDWGTVMEAWFECFARSATSDGRYDRRIADILERGGKSAGDVHRRMARTVRDRARTRPSGSRTGNADR